MGGMVPHGDTGSHGRDGASRRRLRLNTKAGPLSSPDACLCSQQEQGPGGRGPGSLLAPPTTSVTHLQWKCVVFCP